MHRAARVRRPAGRGRARRLAQRRRWFRRRRQLGRLRRARVRVRREHRRVVARAARPAPRAGPTSGGTALRILGEASRSRPSSRACSAAPRAAMPPRRPSCACPTQHPAVRESSAAATMRRTPARSRLSFLLVVRRSIRFVVPCGWASLAWRGGAHSPLNPFSNHSCVMCDRFWALNTRQVPTAAQRQLVHGAPLVLGHAARRRWLSGAGRTLALTLALACFPFLMGP